MPTEPVRRLNDYDYNILREDAYKDVSDELFKLEYKISRLEEELTESSPGDKEDFVFNIIHFLSIVCIADKISSGCFLSSSLLNSKRALSLSPCIIKSANPNKSSLEIHISSTIFLVIFFSG